MEEPASTRGLTDATYRPTCSPVWRPPASIWCVTSPASSSLPTRAAKRCSTRCSTRTECSVSAEEQQWFITTVRIVRPRSDSGLDHCNGASSSDARHYKSIDGIKALVTEHPFSAVPLSGVIGPRKRPVLVAPPPQVQGWYL